MREIKKEHTVQKMKRGRGWRGKEKRNEMKWNIYIYKKIVNTAFVSKIKYKKGYRISYVWTNYYINIRIYIEINWFQFWNIRGKSFCIVQTFGHLTIERSYTLLTYVFNLIQINHFCCCLVVSKYYYYYYFYT